VRTGLIAQNKFHPQLNNFISSVTLDLYGPGFCFIWSGICSFYVRGKLLLQVKKNDVHRHVTPCGSCESRRFEETCRLHHQGDKNQRARKVSSKYKVLFVDSFQPDDLDDTFLRKVGSYKSHAVSHLRIPQILHSRQHVQNTEAVDGKIIQ
jgi:hypothetical protein